MPLTLSAGSRRFGLPALALAAALAGAGPEAVASPQPNIIGPFFAGVVAGHRGDAAAAADYLVELAGRIDPIADVLEPAVGAAISAGRIDQALPLAQVLLEIQPQGSETAALLLLAEAARQGDWETARRMIGHLPTHDLSGTQRQMLEAWVLLPQEGVEAALAALAPLAQRRGLAGLHALHEAMLLDVAGSPEAAEAYTRALESQNPPSGRAVLLASNHLARSGKVAEAEALIRAQLDAGRGNATLVGILEELEAGAPQQPMVPDAAGGLSEVFLQIGAALAEEQPGEMALREARLALLASPRNSAAGLLLGEVLSRIGRHEEAVAAYAALLDDPRHGPVAALGRADSLAASGRIDEALEAYREIAAADPADPEPSIRMGNLLRWERRFGEAVAAYDEAVARLPDRHPGDWLLYYFRGIANERAGNWQAAETDLQEALTLNPEQPQVLNYLGYSWVEQQRNLDLALDMLQRAVNQRPRDGYIVDSLGWALFRLGRYEEAVDELERAVELEPGQAVINDHLGDAYWRVGRQREARVQWQRTLSLGDDPDVDAGTVRQKLRQGLPAAPADSGAD